MVPPCHMYVTTQGESFNSQHSNFNGQINGKSVISVIVLPMLPLLSSTVLVRPLFDGGDDYENQDSE